MPSVLHDALDIPAVLSDIERARDFILALPIECSDGKVIAFSGNHKIAMEGALVMLEADPMATVDWPLDDGSVVTLNYAELKSYFDELNTLNMQRYLMVCNTYHLYKISGATLRQLKNWKAQHGA